MNKSAMKIIPLPSHLGKTLSANPGRGLDNDKLVLMEKE